MEDNYTVNASAIIITTDINSSDYTSNVELPITVTCVGSAFISLLIVTLRFVLVYMKRGRNNSQGSGEINL